MWIGDLTLRLRNWIAEVAQDGPFGNHETLTDGLVSYWALDELSGTRYDSVTATGNDLTDNNTVTYAVEGPSGTSAKFVSASSEYLSANPGIGTMTGDYTVAGWVNFTGYSGYTSADGAGYFAIIENNVDGAMVCAVLPGGEAQLLWWDAGTLRRAYTAAPGDGWHHVVMRNASGTKTIWIDGTSRGLTTSTTSSGWGDTKTNVGRSYAGAGYYFNSTISRLGVWKGTALAESEIVSLYNAGVGKSYADMSAEELTGLTAFWELDEISGTRVDSHGSNDLTDNNTVGSVNSGPEGVVAVFVNANNEVLTNATNVMSADSNFTAVAWTRLRSAATGHANELFSTTDGDFILRCNGEYPQIVGRGFADSTYWNGGTAIPIEQWKMLTGWHDADNNQFGISVDNGVRTTVATGGANGAGTAIAIGARDSTPTDTTETDGDISRVGCWTRVLTADEQNTLFNGGVGLRYADLPAGLLAGLVSYWDLTETSGTRSDSHGTNHLTDNNTVGYTINKGAASEGVGASFVEGNSEALSRADASLVNWPHGDFHLSMWVNTGASTAGHMASKRDGAGAREWRLSTNTSGGAAGDRAYLTASSNGTDEDITLNTGDDSLPPGVWGFVEVEREGTTWKVATNGNAYVTGGSAFFNGEAPFQLGCVNATQALFFTGQIDEVGLWNRVLTAQERTDLFNAGKGLFYGD